MKAHLSWPKDRAAQRPALHPTAAGFTLVELMVVIALVAVVLALAAPSMKEMIEVRRLRAINAQLVTDFHFARSEAIARRTVAKIDFTIDDKALTCYTIYVSSNREDRCDCAKSEAERCKGVATEIRTVQIPRNSGSVISIPNGQAWFVGFESTMGGLVDIPLDINPKALKEYYVDTQIDTARTFRIMLNQSGRPMICAPTGSKLDVKACPAPAL